MDREITLIAHNLRSCHNVGSLLRTAECLNIKSVFLTGYTPYPATTSDDRLPHIAQKIDAQIQKTALGAEKSVSWKHSDSIQSVIEQLKSDGYVIAALEQHKSSTALQDYKVPKKIALIIGRETEGIEKDVMEMADIYLEIPMLGKKESLNVVQAAAMAMYHMRFY